jgi:hypothetical protein
MLGRIVNRNFVEQRNMELQYLTTINSEFGGSVHDTFIYGSKHRIKTSSNTFRLIDYSYHNKIHHKNCKGNQSSKVKRIKLNKSFDN